MKIAKTWALFCIFFFLNSVLSYYPFSTGVKTALFTLAILWPLIWAFRKQKTPTDPLLFQMEFLPDLPLWLWLLLGAAALFIRFYKLETLFIWPNQDEGWYGLFAIGLSEKWNWKFFYTGAQEQPLPIWAAAILYKTGLSPFLCLWLPSALASTLVIPIGYAASRTVFSKSFSWLFGVLLALGYWPFLMGRFCHQAIWLLLWTCGCLFFLGRFWRASPESARKRGIILLGFTAGLGCFTFTSWPSVVLAVVLPLFAGSFHPSFKNQKYIPAFFTSFLAASTPFWIAVWREGYGQYIHSMFAFNGWFTIKHQILTVISYLSELSWGTLLGDSDYVAPEGGMLNPLWGAAFWIGILQLIRYRSNRMVQWLALAFGLCLLPGVLSMNVKMLRVAQALPFLLFVSALGMAQLLREIPKAKRTLILLVILTLGVGFDIDRVLKSHANPLDSIEASAKSGFPLADIRAYEVLKKVSEEIGPGLIFTEFTDQSYDYETLFDMTYPFNAAENTRPTFSGARWAGLLLRADYYPFLASGLPGTTWYRLGKNQPGNQEMMLGTIPFNPQTAKTLERWVKAHHYFRRLNEAINSVLGDKTYISADQLFFQQPDSIRGDRFLESCYWEKRSEFYYKFNFSAHYQSQLESLQKALSEGYPASHLRYELGCLQLRKRNFREAAKNFEAGLKLEPNDPDLLNAYSVLRKMESPSLK